MAQMGDARAAVCCDFLQCLADLEGTRDKPTLDEEDLYIPSPREAELTEKVCEEDCVIAFGPAELRRQLCLTVVRQKLSSLAVIVGHQMAKDDYFVNYLRILLPAEIRIVPSASSWQRGADACVYLMEPDVLWCLLDNGVIGAAEINVLVLRDFEHYLNHGHAYRKIVPCFQKVSRRSTGSLQSMWLLALADDLKSCCLGGLESDLEKLRTPLKLICSLATPVRPHAKEAVLEVCFLELDWQAQVGSIVSSSDDPEVQEVGTTLRERGIVAACCLAKKMMMANPRAELQAFLAQCENLMTKLKGDAVINNAQGKTLALMPTVASRRDLKRWLQSQDSMKVAEELEDMDLMSVFVFVATSADIPTLRQYNWDIVVFCDLPFGVHCDALLEKSNHAIVLATEPQWKRWNEALELHDELENLLLRVNQS